MPGQRGITATFTDELAKVHQALAMAKLAPDADMDFIDEMESKVLERLKPAAPADPLAAMQASMGTPAPGGPGPAPVPMTPAPTRIPGRSPDLREATAALEAGLGGVA